VLGILILLTRGSLAVFTIFLQPYYSFEFTDLRAGLFTGEVESHLRDLPASSCGMRAVRLEQAHFIKLCELQWPFFAVQSRFAVACQAWPRAELITLHPSTCEACFMWCC
jgi:hypothetical protein